MILFIIFILIIFIIISYTYIGAVEKNMRGEIIDISPVKYRPWYSRELPPYKEQYTSRPQWTKLSIKLGQRKLFFNELEFYTHIWKQDKNPIIVYAGAAAGIHSVFLSKLFEGFDFYFYDPNPFYDDLKQCKNVHLFQEYFTDKVASSFSSSKKGRNIYFLSDIRTGTDEKYISIDMENQLRWCEIIKPKMAMLKFRLPWTAGTTKFYAGKIYTQPRIGPVSTETRLWTDCKKIIEYDHDEYNNRCFYFNKCVRDAWHSFSFFETSFEKKSELPKQVLEKNGIDHCYDCWSEIKIITDFLKCTKANYTISSFLIEVDKATFSTLNMPPHNLMPEEKDIWKKILKMKQIIISYRNEKNILKLNKKQQRIIRENRLNTFKIFADEFYKKLRNPPATLLNSETGSAKIGLKWCANAKPRYNMLLGPDIKPVKYRTTEIYERLPLQSSKRSGFIMFIKFMSARAHLSKDVVIFTSKSGRYIFKMVRMFPAHTFHIFFPHGSIGIEEPNLIMYYEPLTYLKAQKLAPVKPLFICELFLVSESVPQKKVNTHIHKIQMDLCKKLECPYALLQYFNMSESSEFFTGDLYLPPWKKQLSGVLRLETDCKETKKYDAPTIDSQLFNFDTCIRSQWYKWPASVSSSSLSETSFGKKNKFREEKTSFGKKNKFHEEERTGIDHCYDCWAEQVIWGEYIKSKWFIKNDDIYISDDIQSNMKNLFYYKYTGYVEKKDNDEMRGSLFIPPHGMLPNEKNYLVRMQKLTNLIIYRDSIFKSAVEELNFRIKKINKILTYEDYIKMLK